MESTPLKRVTTLEGMGEVITSKRKDGNTTRLIDNAIQILFKGHICVVLDHHEMGKHEGANKDLFNAILRRLDNEHRLFFNKEIVKFDKKRLEIRIVT